MCAERLRRKDEEIVRALEEKQRLIEDILRLPSSSRIEDSGSSASSLSAASSSASGGCGSTRCGAAEILLTALTQG